MERRNIIALVVILILLLVIVAVLLGIHIGNSLSNEQNLSETNPASSETKVVPYEGVYQAYNVYENSETGKTRLPYSTKQELMQNLNMECLVIRPDGTGFIRSLTKGNIDLTVSQSGVLTFESDRKSQYLLSVENNNLIMLPLEHSNMSTYMEIVFEKTDKHWYDPALSNPIPSETKPTSPSKEPTDTKPDTDQFVGVYQPGYVYENTEAGRILLPYETKQELIESLNAEYFVIQPDGIGFIRPFEGEIVRFFVSEDGILTFESDLESHYLLCFDNNNLVMLPLEHSSMPVYREIVFTKTNKNWNDSELSTPVVPWRVSYSPYKVVVNGIREYYADIDALYMAINMTQIDFYSDGTGKFFKIRDSYGNETYPNIDFTYQNGYIRMPEDGQSFHYEIDGEIIKIEIADMEIFATSGWPAPEDDFPANQAQEINLEQCINAKDLTMQVGAYFKIWGTNKIDSSVVSWSSSDPTVASVNNGIVTAHKKGNAEIIAQYQDQRVKCFVRVVE